MDYTYGTKKYGGIAISALLIFGAVAAVLVVPHAAYAATSITASSDKFYGPNLLRVVITDTAKNTASDTIIAHVDVKRGSSVLGSKDMTLSNIGSSGTFELFVTTSNTLNPAAPTFTGTGGAFVLRVNTGPATVNTNDQTITTASNLQDGDSVVVTYGGQTQTVQFAKSNAVASVDRNTAGSGNNVVLTLTDTDANIDPTKVDIFNATGLATTSAGTLTLTGAKFKETGQNTNAFELVIAVAASAPTDGASLTATFPSSATLTINDKDVYVAGNGPVAFNTVTPGISSITSSKSVTLQNVDGVMTTLMPITLGNGIQLQINDSDRNIDTQSRDTIASSALNVTVAGVTGIVNGTSLKETTFGSGLFLPDTTDNKIPISAGTSDSITATGITLTNATIAGDPDITISYKDPAADPSGQKIFKLITHLTHTAGTLTGPSQAGVTDKFSLTITDPDLNSNSKSVDSFIVTFPASQSTGNQVYFGNGLGSMTLKAKGNALTLGSALTMTFIETDINSGVFVANNIDMSIINSAVSGGLSDGDQIEFKLSDNSEDPVQTSTATFSIGKPTASISINRGTIPLPRALSTDGSKFTVTIVDPTQNTNSNSVDTISVGSNAWTMTKKDGSTQINPILMTGLGTTTFTETGPNTGVFTADYTVKAGTETNINMDSAKLKFTYTSGGTTSSASVTVRSYDGTVTSNVSALQNGGNLTITVSDPDLNKDSATAEQASVTVQGKSDDQTLVTISDLKETGVDTGVFTKTITVGKDFKISDLTGNKFSTSVEIHYNDLIASDLSTGVDREFDGTVKTSSGTIAVTPTLVGPGTKLFIEVKDPDLNANPQGIDTTQSGVEYIRVTSDRSGANTMTTAVGEETGANTGIFRTKLTLSPITTNPAPSPLFPPNTTKEITGFVLPGDILSIRYTDQKDSSGSKATVAQVIKVISADPIMNSSKTTVDANGSTQITVTDPDANTDGDAVDSVTLKVTSTSDPVGVSVTALETGPNTGVFTGMITTTTGVTTGSVSAKVGDNVMVKYTDKYPADYADRVKQVVDPSKDFTFVVPVGIASGGDVNATTAANPVLKDFSGKDITEVTSGQQVVLSSTVTNNQGTVRPFAAIVEVRNADGETVYLQWQQGTLNANGSTNIGLSWTPDASGTYTARTFVVTNISSPAALSTVSESTITVS